MKLTNKAVVNIYNEIHILYMYINDMYPYIRHFWRRIEITIILSNKR